MLLGQGQMIHIFRVVTFLILVLTLIQLSGCANKEKIKTQAPYSQQVNRYNTSTSYEWLKKTVRIANCVNNNKDFIDEVRSIKSFYFSNNTGEQVAVNLVSSIPAQLYTYKTRNPFSKVTGYRDPITGKIFFNTRKNPRSTEQMVNTAIHERLHNWYNHNGNLAKGKNLESVPYKIGSISMKYVKQCNF